MEAGAAILFFGVFAQQAELHQAANTAVAELSAQGYRLPSEDDPLRVFPALTGGEFSARHAGGWRPGGIYLRPEPQGGFQAAVYLRHELFHEASHRSCGGRLPVWAEEAGAMRFSGELAGLEPGAWPGEAELQGLKQRIRQGAELDGRDRILLGRLVVNAGWPRQPCTLSVRLSELLGSEFDTAGGSGYLLMSLLSGRILASGGDQASRLPPGSLLKIPYAAALRQANPAVLAAELAGSDTDKLLARRAQFQPERYRLLLSPIRENRLPVQDQPADEQGWRAYLGERATDGGFPLQADLPELATALRAALLWQPAYFQGLSQNGVTAGSTLYGQSAEHKNLLRQLQAMAKTGTVSAGDGRILAGHLLVAWPAPHPLYLAVFRQRGVRGASVLPKAAGLLKAWRNSYPPDFAAARVRLLTATPPGSWEAQTDCPELSGPSYRFTLCGQFRIVSTAPGSRSVRLVEGLLHESASNGPAVLETDIDSYADAVLAAEAQTLTGGTREALRAVIAWNAGHGGHRHRDSESLCDTTHCMVFLGRQPGAKPAANGKTDAGLLRLLTKLAADNGLNWLPFAQGGDRRWQRQIAGSELRTRFAENRILEIRRERRKSGELFIHLYYPDSEETISCEIFRNTLKLPSCPDAIASVAENDAWQFQGIGAGHGLGLSMAQAQALAEHGRSAEQILRDAYGAANNPEN